jgi:formate--tetrahydrofolate ligase
MLTDIEIARKANMKNINEIANELNIKSDNLEQYGHYKAKISLNEIDESKIKNSNLILVTALSPTPAGEGKTTVSIGLLDGLNKIGKNAMAALREPSLGPVFGIKGGAAGGGYSQVVPMEDINLHFTGDFSAIEKANNLLSAMIDNNIQAKSGNLGIDPRTVIWKRAMDMNDRALRNIVIGMGGRNGGMIREDGFNITAASEVMAILCMSKDVSDLKERLGNIYIANTYDNKPIYAKDLMANEAMAILLKEAIKPNLVQTLENNPVIIHGGPFANIAQGTNSILATKMAMSLADYVVTEAGFGADLGAEKFLDIKMRAAGLVPSLVVIVGTIRALKYHGGVALADLNNENLDAVKSGFVNLQRHIENVKNFGLNCVIAINKFPKDTEKEVQLLKSLCKEIAIDAEVSEGFAKGGDGTTKLAEIVASNVNKPDKLNFTYDLNQGIKEKVEAVCKKIYRASSVNFSSKAEKDIDKINNLRLSNLPICIAKTQYSFTDNPKILAAPENFEITIREIEIAAGAGFVVPIAGDMMRMPGLPATPAAVGMTINDEGEVFGLS